jgi:acyl carrier protein
MVTALKENARPDNPLQDRVTKLLVEQFWATPEAIDSDTTLGDLAFDSLILIEFTLIANKEFGVAIEDDELTEDLTVADVADLLAAKGATG